MKDCHLHYRVWIFINDVSFCHLSVFVANHIVTKPTIWQQVPRFLHTHGLWPDRAVLTYSAMHEQEGTIQLYAAAKYPKMDI